MKLTWKSTCAAALLMAGMTGQAAADAVLYTSGFTPELVVSSNGQLYTQLQNNGNARIDVRFGFKLDGAGRIRGWDIWPTINRQLTPVAELKPYAQSKNYSVGKRPKSVSRNLSFNIPVHELEVGARSQCNLNANRLRNEEGMSNAQIFSKDRVVYLISKARGTVHLTWPNYDTFLVEEIPYQVKIRCAKWQGSKIPQAGNGTLQAPSHVRRAKLTLAEVANQAGACAVKLTTKISTNLPNVTVKYRYEHSNGKKSKVFTTKTGANKVAVTTRQWDVPNSKGPEVGAVRVVGVSHDFTTHIQNYHMKCVDGPGGFAANPVEIRKATMKLREIATRAGACGLKLTTAISTNKPGATIKYRYVHSSGKKSNVFTTKTAQNKIAVVTHQWDVPNRKGTERGRIKLVGVSPKFSPNLSNYSMNCVDAPRGLRATPGKPKVRIPLGSTRLKN